MKIRISIIFFALFIITSNLIGQEIRGLIIDSESELPIEFVNIGVVDVSSGTITNESGIFILDCKKLPKDCKINISMIGYEPKTFNLNDLMVDTTTIKLVRKTYELDEVTIKWKEIIRKLGTVKTSKLAGVCGLQGTQKGKGHELGLLIHLGDNPVMIEDVNLKIRKHSYDTIVFRLHIRSIENGLPVNELLTQNIYLPISKYKGWQKFDLSEYRISISGDVVLSIEWIKISNVIEKNLIKMNGSKVATPNILFDINDKIGTLYSRWGSAARWKIEENKSLGFYITIKE
ncbi:MAG: carboxypeptidase-like regulatory domain-containing protein [bacterium]|nr:carboxypeptidase-like regulatory domain-containing protein [bacterium]